MNRELCRLVKSIRGKPKIIVRGYLLVKDKNRDEKYYWCCEYRHMYHCKGRASTILNGQEHELIRFNEHNHAPEASQANVVQTLNTIKEVASSTSSNNSRCHKDKNMPPQPRSLQDINIPSNLRVTINGDQFLAKELEIGKMIIFLYIIQPSAFTGSRLLDDGCWGEDNTRVFPLVYTLMTNKTEESYRQLFQELVDSASVQGQIAI
ncbi:hypothetical protein C1646_749029 [Rhizophagus diaphanus]|nr:hypothetical protein C1646_749029 [Rhizophagus diaphanus] [Rhizophagus sp. MUCL 43196]